MPEPIVAELAQIVDVIESSGGPIEPETLAPVGERLASAFHVDDDEVAILMLIEDDRFLRFLIPEKLRVVGVLPMTSTTSLAVRTVREKRADVVNNFAASRHASVFEGVPMGRPPGVLIQRIMSAPLLHDEKVVGVVQISRKGQGTEDAGPDFTQKDLKALLALTGELGRLVHRCQENG